MIPQCAGKPYRPPNGTDGMIFQERWCDHCVHDKYTEEVPEAGCIIIARSMRFDIGEFGYPEEWIYDQEGIPKCTKFEEVP